jgi:tripartite-type tricarboxylate transporter receptor subunit TctC
MILTKIKRSPLLRISWRARGQLHSDCQLSGRNTVLSLRRVGAQKFGEVAWAQAYPTKSVRLIVPFAAGGPNDILAPVGQWLSDRLGQPFITENQPLAGDEVRERRRTSAIGHMNHVDARHHLEKLAPTWPTVGEFVPGFDASIWFGIGAPKNTPGESRPAKQRN